MRLLLDTCTFLWLAIDDPKLSKKARRLVVDPDNEVFLSAASAWEIAIKHGLGQLPLPERPTEYVRSRREALMIEPAPFDENAATHVALLPPIHRDPFDRALVAQAIVSGLCLVTPDPVMRRYPAPVVW